MAFLTSFYFYVIRVKVVKLLVIGIITTAAGDSTFIGWSGACFGIGECVVILNGDKSITTSFNQSRADVALITHYYLSILRRELETEELAFW